MRRTCGFRRLLLVSALLVPLMAGIGGATAATASPGAPTQTCTSPNCPITINDNSVSAVQDQASSPYPSQIGQGVADPTPFIDKVTVTLTGLSHASLDDIDVLLLSGTGSRVVELMSDAGGRTVPTVGVNLTFDDAASASLPNAAPPLSGTYKPTNYPGTEPSCVPDNPPLSSTSDPFPGPAPPPPSGGYSQTLQSFHGQPFGGFWRLFVGDDCAGGSGTIESWSLNLTFIACGELCVVKRADAVTTTVGSPIGFTLQVSDNRFFQDPDPLPGGLSDPLPSGLGINWSIDPPYSGQGTCSIAGAVGSQQLDCSFVFPPSIYETVHVSSPTSACGTYSNTATLYMPMDTAQDTDSTTVTGCPTAVSLSSFAATYSRRGVLTRWRTASESGTLGFNLYRKRTGKLRRVNSTLIPSVFGGSASGHAYSWLDRRALRESGVLEYRLQAVGLDGTRRWLGASIVSR